jgi:hypothetical protein
MKQPVSVIETCFKQGCEAVPDRNPPPSAKISPLWVTFSETLQLWRTKKLVLKLFQGVM